MVAVVVVGRSAEGDGAGAVAGADEVAVGEVGDVGAVDGVGVVAVADEAIIAGEPVEELDGGVVRGTDG